MATVGSLIALLGLDQSGFQKGLSRADRSMERFGNKSRKTIAAMRGSFQGLTAGAVTRYGAAIAALAGPAALGALTVASQKALDTQAKFADRLSISQRALGELQHAANQTAGDAGKNLPIALQRMTRRIADAEQGAGPAAKALDALGLSAARLAQLAPDEQFLAIGDAMRQVQNSGEQVRLTFSLFDSEGVGLINTLRQSRESMRDMATEAQLLGIAVSRVDGAAIESANDAAARAKGVFAGLGNQLAVQFAPILEAASDAFVQMALDAGGTGMLVQKAMKAGAQSVAFLADVINGLKVVWRGVTFAGAAAAAALSQFLQPIITMAERAYNTFAMVTGADPLSVSSQQIVDQAQRNATAAADAFDKALMAKPPGAALLERWEQTTLEFNRRMAEKVAGSADNSIADAGEGEDPRVIAERQRQAELTRLTEQGEKERFNWTKATQKKRLAFTLGNITQMTQGVAAGNKAMFRLNKMAAIAQAVVNLPAHVSETMKAYPYPLSLAMGGLAAAASLAQINAIRSTSFGGGGGGGGGGVGGATTPSLAGQFGQVNGVPVSSGSDVQTFGQQQQQRRSVDVTVRGSLFGSDTIEGLVTAMEDALSDGVGRAKILVEGVGA
jgi:hypothetical protein